MFWTHQANKAKAAGGERHRPESENVNPQDVVSGKEVTIDKETVLDAVWSIFRFFTAMNTRLARQDRNVSKALKAGEDRAVTLERCFDTIGDCQRQTADLANQAIERHALHPSILAVDLLANTLCQLAQQAQALGNSQPLDPEVMSLVASIFNAAEIAEDKKASLGIQSIQPAEMDKPDKDIHQIVKAVETDDQSKHKKIHETLSVGLIYRGKVLREAKVSVYRFSENIAE